MDQDHSIRAVVVYPGARVMDATGEVVVVDMVRNDGVVMGRGAWDRVPRPVHVVCDAWGGEADQSTGLLSCAA